MADKTRAEAVARPNASGRTQRGATQAPWLSDYTFLIRSADDVEALLEAEVLATQWGVPLLSALFAAGRITEGRYAQNLAAALSVPYADGRIALAARVAAPIIRTRTTATAAFADGFWDGQPALFVAAASAPPAVIARRIARAPAWSPERVIVLVTGRTLSVAAERARAPNLVKAATYALRRQLPLYSAGRLAPVWQLCVMAALPVMIAGGLLAETRATLTLLMLGLTVPFAGATLVRLVALLGQLGQIMGRRGTTTPAPRAPDRDLPAYSILVALFEEAAVLPSLIAALERLDYPPAKLDCLLVIEDADMETKLAFLKSELPAWMRVVVVPDGVLRTKPRALNYALRLARGDYVVVYDAEDRPEPDQLRRALVAADKASGPSSQQIC